MACFLFSIESCCIYVKGLKENLFIRCRFSRHWFFSSLKQFCLVLSEPVRWSQLWGEDRMVLYSKPWRSELSLRSLWAGRPVTDAANSRVLSIISSEQGQNRLWSHVISIFLQILFNGKLKLEKRMFYTRKI